MEIRLFKLKTEDGTTIGTYYIVPRGRNAFCQKLSDYRKNHGPFLPWSEVENLAYEYASILSYEALMTDIRGRDNDCYQIELM